MRIVSITFLFIALLLGGCASNIALTDGTDNENETSPEVFVSRIIGTCAGFAKSGAEQGYGTQIDIFNFCIDKAIEHIEKAEESKV